MAHRYSDPAFISEAHAWARESCRRLDLAIVGEIEQPHIRPWSTVFRVPTTSFDVFLKCCGGNQAHEPRLTALLAETRPRLLPELLALHPTRPWMLVADGGAKLREAERAPALEAWAEVLPRYAELQRAVATRVGELLAIGTPDHRLETLASRFEALLRDGRVFPTELETRRQWLFALLPRVAEEARELDSLGIGPSVQHDDLHDGNILVRDGRPLVFDWGDACISHPFFSMLIVSNVVADRGGFREGAPELARLRDAYLEPWTLVAPRRTLLAAYGFVRRLGRIDHVLTWHRVASYASDDALSYIAESEIAWLREIIEVYL